MPSAVPIIVELDRSREVRWTARAEARLSAQDYTVALALAAAAKPRKSFYGICLFLWAGLVDRDHSFAQPEDLAEYLQTEVQQLAAWAAIKAMLIEADIIADSKKKPASGESGSASGRKPSSS